MVDDSICHAIRLPGKYLDSNELQWPTKKLTLSVVVKIVDRFKNFTQIGLISSSLFYVLMKGSIYFK